MWRPRRRRWRRWGDRWGSERERGKSEKTHKIHKTSCTRLYWFKENKAKKEKGMEWRREWYKNTSLASFPKEQQNKSLFYVCAILETIGTIHFYFGLAAAGHWVKEKDDIMMSQIGQSIIFGFSSRNYVDHDVFIVFTLFPPAFDIWLFSRFWWQQKALWIEFWFGFEQFLAGLDDPCSQRLMALGSFGWRFSGLFWFLAEG